MFVKRCPFLFSRPLPGSKTEERGLRAKSHIHREILELCEAIYDLDLYNKELKRRRRVLDGQEDNEDDQEEDDGSVIVTFGELFEVSFETIPKWEDSLCEGQIGTTRCCVANIWSLRL